MSIAEKTRFVGRASPHFQNPSPARGKGPPLVPRVIPAPRRTEREPSSCFPMEWASCGPGLAQRPADWNLPCQRGSPSLPDPTPTPSGPGS